MNGYFLLRRASCTTLADSSQSFSICSLKVAFWAVTTAKPHENNTSNRTNCMNLIFLALQYVFLIQILNFFLRNTRELTLKLLYQKIFVDFFLFCCVLSTAHTIALRWAMSSNWRWQMSVARFLYHEMCCARESVLSRDELSERPRRSRSKLLCKSSREGKEP